MYIVRNFQQRNVEEPIPARSCLKIAGPSLPRRIRSPITTIGRPSTTSPRLAPMRSSPRLATRAGPENLGMSTRTNARPSTGSTLKRGPATSTSEGLTSRERSLLSIAQPNWRVHAVFSVPSGAKRMVSASTSSARLMMVPGSGSPWPCRCHSPACR